MTLAKTKTYEMTIYGWLGIVIQQNKRFMSSKSKLKIKVNDLPGNFKTHKRSK